MTESVTSTAPSSTAHAPTRPAAVAAQVGTFAALIAVFGVAGTIPVPGLLVPVTLQTLAVMLAGALLGPRRGAAAVLTLLALAAVGLPVLSGGRGGLGVFVSPSAGYLLGWVVAAFVVGLLVDRSVRRRGRLAFWPVLVACLVGGIGALYAVAIPILALVTGMDLAAAALANVVYLPGDALKAVLAASVTVGVARAYPAVLTHRGF
ncbi:biotin transport system substrate-specific component [Paraoerskovia marina]|uniref:Biotin transporter n=1 Tax=Paraoerskovia marina TaxID=545619 RepID=A0A1H1UBH7_9CELL|nr:biotin transporter BioY [Paraoerskovia marina]SDS69827.1 biotin transport system substrate-specific component [Paraoerskovia marina]